jgi:methionine-rich copper-binding protein CopC
VLYGTGRSAGMAAWVVAVVIGVVGVVLTAVFFVFSAAPVWAHTALEASSPKDEGKIAVAPTRVVLKFTEPILNTGARVVVQGPDGRTYQGGAPQIAGDRLTQLLQPLGPTGAYRVKFRVVADDGHPQSFAMSFTLTKPGPAAGGASADDRQIALAPVYSTAGSANNAPAWAAWIGGVLAVALISGAIWFGRRTTRDLD